MSDIVQRDDCKGENCDGFWFDLESGRTWVLSDRTQVLNDFKKYMEATARPLSKDEIQLAIDLIKGERRLPE